MFGHRAPPADWQAIVAARVAHWSLLDDSERERLGADIEWLLRKKHWEVASGFDDFELTDEICVTVAAQAALLILGLDRSHYDDVGAVVVWPTTIVRTRAAYDELSGEFEQVAEPLLGEASGRRGPVHIAWDEAVENARHPELGLNVVFHEFAHKIDLADGMVDGTPRMLRRTDVEDWVHACRPVYEAMQAGVDRPPLRDYGATNVGEFFAVATEAFFDVPIDLERNEQTLYNALRDFYNQDPAERVRRRPLTAR
ncbi:MAG: zinc-dependent peptidase [Acidimicrobiia bacterium]